MLSIYAYFYYAKLISVFLESDFDAKYTCLLCQTNISVFWSQILLLSIYNQVQNLTFLCHFMKQNADFHKGISQA